MATISVLLDNSKRFYSSFQPKEGEKSKEISLFQYNEAKGLVDIIKQLNLEEGSELVRYQDCFLEFQAIYEKHITISLLKRDCNVLYSELLPKDEIQTYSNDQFNRINQLLERIGFFPTLEGTGLQEYQDWFIAFKDTYIKYSALPIDDVSLEIDREAPRNVSYLPLDQGRRYEKNLLKWQTLNLNPDWFYRDPVGADTLLSTRLIYSVLGFQNTMGTEEIRFNEENGLEIRLDGEFCSVKDVIRNRFVFSYDGGGTIQEKSTKKNWTFLGTSGLVPVDRWTHEEFLPILTLNNDQLEGLREHVRAKDENVDFDTQNCFIQFITSPRDFCSGGDSIKVRLKKNYQRNYPLHAWIRLIDENGNVYSTGFGSTEAQDKLQEKMGYFSTINGMPTILDYEEFRAHEGRITNTFAISEEKFTNVLQTIKKDREETIRFNIVAQNCNTLALKYLKSAGVEFGDIKLKARSLLFLVIPDEFNLKKYINVLKYYTPYPIKVIVQCIAKVAQMIFEHLVSFFFLNPMLMYYGWNQKTQLPAEKSAEDKRIKEKSWIHPFSNAFNLDIDFSSKSIEEQFREDLAGNVFVHRYKGPRVSIVPPSDPDPKDIEVMDKMSSVYS
jgi:hypothetical protein